MFCSLISPRSMSSVDEHEIAVRSGTQIELGFTFSFPVLQTSINHGTLISWTKGFNARNMVGKDPVTFLQDAFNRRHIPVRVGKCSSRVSNLGVFMIPLTDPMLIIAKKNCVVCLILISCLGQRYCGNLAGPCLQSSRDRHGSVRIDKCRKGHLFFFGHSSYWFC
jgi:hypothetical protein